jgi:hypothetical protein
MLAFLLWGWKEQAQVHCIMNESTSVFPKTTS